MSEPDFDEDGRPLTDDAAKLEIERIFRKQVIFTDEEQADIRKRVENTDLQNRFSDLVVKARTEAGTFAKTSVLFSCHEYRCTNASSVAEQLYSSRFRFIYELLQNVDDSCYAKGVEPFVTFRIKPEELIVESNELGFTREDTISICDTAKSSKAGNIDTTGEKGLGFKSVFGIADYVHIKSGCWSFRFEHREGDDGLGMICPIWTDHTPALPREIGTRLTLRYSDRGASFARLLVSEFKEIPRTILFALRQLKKIVVVVDRINGREEKITFTRDGELNSDEMRLKIAVKANFGKFGPHTSGTTRLRLFTTTVQDLPLDGKHKDPEREVTVAFEVDSEGLPVIPKHGQYVFARLPVRRYSQLPFLINADFDLSSNREDVSGTPWNEALLAGVSASFVGLVMEAVAIGDPLEFRWVRYLPTVPMQDFWKNLCEDISACLKEEPVLRSRRGRLHYIDDMRALPDWFIYKNEPLVEDTSHDIYLSENYEPADITILKTLSLKTISPQKILKRIKEAEISIPDKPLDDRWHTAFTGLVRRLLDTDVKEDVEDLNIIPLQDGRWVSPSSLKVDKVYLPYLAEEYSVKIEIPHYLGFQVLDLTAAADGERKSFYAELGVSSCAPNDVITKILERHRVKFGGPRRRKLSTLIKDLEVLFWFGMMPSPSERGQERVTLMSDQSKRHQARFLFFPSDDDYHAEKLLAKTPKEYWGDYGVLHEQYLESQVSNYKRSGLDWVSYLEKWGVKFFPDLVHEVPNGWKLHPLMEEIAHDNPDSFVANLKVHWSDYRDKAARITNDLKEVRVPCLNGSAESLGDTILPTDELLKVSEDSELTGLLPFLKLPADFDSHRPEPWLFLRMFGVICEADTNFYLRALHQLTELEDAQLISTCATLYSGIAQTTAIGNAEILQV
ncbi:hypothetical protein LTS17_005081 [Exophiala oligosperma]